jgi:hypothetical protein
MTNVRKRNLKCDKKKSHSIGQDNASMNTIIPSFNSTNFHNVKKKHPTT